jgi:hypothetical protein
VPSRGLRSGDDLRGRAGAPPPAARNVISGNACNAVFVAGANNNRIQGNYVGTDKTGTKGLTKSPTAHFKFTSPDPQATYECSLDGGAY